jgi:glucose-6-phosphate dehydrogenase assembly protein OpcA
VGAAETVVVGMREGGVVERVSDFISQLLLRTQPPHVWHWQPDPVRGYSGEGLSTPDFSTV